jgi:hypothetical protein
MPVFYCDVCQESGSPPAAILDCGHTFHAHCMLTWANARRESGQEPSCPVCRGVPTPMPLLTPDIVDVTFHSFHTPLRRATHMHTSNYLTLESMARVSITYGSARLFQYDTAAEIWFSRQHIPTLLQLVADFITNEELLHPPPIRSLVDRLAPTTRQLISNPDLHDDDLLRNPTVINELRALAQAVAHQYQPERERRPRRQG